MVGRFMVGRFAVLLTGTIAVWAVLGGMAHAQTASALVLETRGANLPHLSPYSEIPANTTVALPQEGKLVFLHYPTCRTVTVIGGTIAFGEGLYTITGGTTEAEAPSACPRVVQLTAEYQTGGILMRGRQDGTLTLAPDPAFVLVGKRAGDFAAVRVSEGGREVVTAPLDGRRFQWPSKTPPLSQDREYELALIPRRAGEDSVTRRLKVAPAVRSPRAGLTLVRVE